MLDGEFTTLRTVKWRNQAITLKTPVTGRPSRRPVRNMRTTLALS
jgi:hypothetical protein